MSRVVASGEPVASYRAVLGCPRCEGQLTHVTVGTGGLDTRAIARCDACRRDYALVVTLYDITGELARPQAVEGQRHGTYGCYTHGCRRPECRAAAAAYQRERRQRRAGAA